MKARAHVNFALIKYWGKKDELKRLPYQASLSFTVDKLYTDTKITFDSSLSKDRITINNSKSNKKAIKRTRNYLNLLRKELNINEYVYFKSNNNVPISAGLASSASSFASIALAFSKAKKLNLNQKELSRLARLGSGSATRSIYGGFSVWKTGNDQTSFAEPFKLKWEDFRIIVVMVDKSEKKVGSTEAMKKSVENKTSYYNWIKASEKDLKEIKRALKNKDIEEVGKIAERNSNHMHQLIKSSGINYQTKMSLKVISKIEDLRNKGVKAYYTMDAGPNVKIITTKKYQKEIINAFLNFETIICQQGPKARVI